MNSTKNYIENRSGFTLAVMCLVPPNLKQPPAEAAAAGAVSIHVIAVAEELLTTRFVTSSFLGSALNR